MSSPIRINRFSSYTPKLKCWTNYSVENCDSMHCWLLTSRALAVAFGRSYQSTTAKLFQSLAAPFESHRQAYVRQWQRAVVNPKFDFNSDTSDGGGMYRLSRCVLTAHEDKVFQGAIVASMSIPWGETKGDNDLGGYHLVWTRDLVQSATALLATGQTSTPLRALIWLA